MVEFCGINGAGDVPRHWPELEQTSPLRPRLFHYPPGLRQAAHNHHAPHASIVMAGSLLEESGGVERMLAHGMMALRADGARHSVRIGPAGALVLSFDLAEPPTTPRWGITLVATGDIGAAALGSFTALQRHDGMAMPALPAALAHRTKSESPADWLRQVANHLIARPQTRIATLARAHAIHRVHLARLFKQHYGLPPSVFRRRAMTTHALAAVLVRKQDLAGAAAEAGFVDQSHMTRATGEACGMTLGRIRALLGGALHPYNQAVGLRR